MTQSEAVRQWWAALDEVDRRRVLRVIDEEVDLLAEDLVSSAGNPLQKSSE